MPGTNKNIHIDQAPRQDFRCVPFVQLLKNSDLRICNNWRSISLLKVVGKIVSNHKKQNSFRTWVRNGLKTNVVK